jgi:hypothetical protein
MIACINNATRFDLSYGLLSDINTPLKQEYLCAFMAVGGP